MADIYFHIGMPKSGSSAIRTALMVNEPSLSRQGYVVGIADDDLTSHYLLNASAFSEHSRDVLSRHYFKQGHAPDQARIDDFANRLSQANRAVLTSEIAFWAQSPRDIFAFEIAKHQVHPVLIARNQMEIINNAIGEMLFDFDLQYEEAFERALKAEIDYADIFYRWAGVFETFRLIRYDENILPQFATAIGSPDHFQADIFENVSMPGSVSQFLYRQKPYVETQEEWEFIIRYFRQHPSTARFLKTHCCRLH